MSKKWNMKAKLSHVLDVPNFENFEVSTLSCGCNCEDCKSTYKAYWMKKLECEDWDQRYQSETLAIKNVVGEVSAMETAHKRVMKELKNELLEEKKKYSSLHESLEKERQLRIEDVYKAQQQLAGVQEVHEENSKLKSSVFNLQEEYNRLVLENNKMKDIATESSRVNEKLLRQIERYEFEIQQLELANASLRKNLFDTNCGLQQFQFRNSRSQSSLSGMDNSSVATRKSLKSFDLPALSLQPRPLPSMPAIGSKVNNMNNGRLGVSSQQRLSLTALAREHLS